MYEYFVPQKRYQPPNAFNSLTTSSKVNVFRANLDIDLVMIISIFAVSTIFD